MAVSGTTLIDMASHTDPGSRVVLAGPASGWIVDGNGPGGTVVARYARLLPRLAQRLTEFQIPPVWLPLKAVVANPDSKYALTRRGVISGVPQFESFRPDRFVGTASPENAASTLDGFFLGEEPFSQCPDGMLWDCALIVAAAHGLQGDLLRSLNDSLAIGLALRVGLLVDRSKLPGVDRPGR